MAHREKIEVKQAHGIRPPQMVIAELRDRLEHAQAMINFGDLIRLEERGFYLWSEQLRRIYGLEPGSEPVPIEDERFCLADEREKVALATLWRGAQDNVPQRCIYRIRRRDGALRTLQAIFHWKVRPNGAPEALTGIVQDVTEQRVALIALQASERRARLLSDNVQDGIFSAELGRFRFTYANPATESITGYSQDELGTMALPMLLTETSMGILREALGATMVSPVYKDAPLRLALELRRKDGKQVWVEVMANLLRDDDGDFEEMVGVVRDITEQKRSEALLRRRTELSQMLAESAAWLGGLPSEDVEEGIGKLLAVVGRFLEVDAAWLVFLGEKGEILKLFQWESLTAQPSEPAVRRMDSRFMTAFHAELVSRGSISIENVSALSPTVQRKVLEELGLAAILFVPISRAGVTVAVMGLSAFRGPRLWEDHLPATMRVLGESLVNALQRARHEDELRRAKAAAEEANRLKSFFVSNVSHEMRTPLNGIIGFAELIAQTDSLLEAKVRSQVIIQESEVMLQLVNDLLDHAKMEEGKLDLTPEPMDLHELLRGIEKTFRPMAEKKGLVLQTALEASLPKHVVGDYLRLRQVLVNLVSNAVKFTHRGYVEIRGEAATDEAGMPHVKITVTDTGVGIPKERQEAIFESFTQVDARTTRSYGGTGLGTTIARRLVQLMGGDIGLQSEEGKGSSFWFDVPLPPCDESQNIVESAPAPEGTAPVSRSRAHRVLVAEDYPVNQQIARQHLESNGFHVTIADNGATAVDLCREQNFDLILMDVQMPVMDGFEATRSIRGQSLNARTPILALTASAEARVRQECISSGMDDVLTKPIRRNILLSAIARWLRHSTGGTTAVAASPLSVQAPAESPVEPVAAAIDEALLLEQFADNRTLAVSALRQLVRSVEGHLPTLHKALAERDFECLRREAHKIKGGAAAVTAKVVSDAASLLEQAAQSSEEDTCRNALEGLTKTWEAALPVLSTWK